MCPDGYGLTCGGETEADFACKCHKKESKSPSQSLEENLTSVTTDETPETQEEEKVLGVDSMTIILILAGSLLILLVCALSVTCCLFIKAKTG